MLAEIVDGVRKDARERLQKTPLTLLVEKISVSPPPSSLAHSLALPEKPRIIAEIKRSSPSAGPLRPELVPAVLAKSYQEAGAAAISVLTEKNYFRGSLDDLRRVKETVRIPVLQKDFILEPYQVYEARAFGADAILLIAALHSQEMLKELFSLADSLGLSVLLEIHDETELEKALLTGAGIIGVNNRNLTTFEVDLKTSFRLLPMIPEDRIKVIESGLKGRDDIKRLMEKGASAFLIGESLLRAPEPAAALANLLLGVAKQ